MAKTIKIRAPHEVPNGFAEVVIDPKGNVGVEGTMLKAVPETKVGVHSPQIATN